MMSSWRSAPLPHGTRKDNGRDPMQTFSDDLDEVYCVCRQPYTSEEMIECTSCNDWFHPTCVGLQNVSDVPEDEPYHCPQCSSQDLDTSSSSADDHFHIEQARSAPHISVAKALQLQVGMDETPTRADHIGRQSPWSVTDSAEDQFRHLALSPGMLPSRTLTPDIGSSPQLRSRSDSLPSNSSSSSRRKKGGTRGTVLKKTTTVARVGLTAASTPADVAATAIPIEKLPVKPAEQQRPQAMSAPADATSSRSGSYRDTLTPPPSKTTRRAATGSGGKAGAKSDVATKRHFHNGEQFYFTIVVVFVIPAHFANVFVFLL